MEKMNTTKRMNLNKKMKDEIHFWHGANCVNCGSSENIEYHHIVPICLGGWDEVPNIVPLCHACHMAAHRGRHMTEYLKKGGKASGGRKPKIPDEEAFKVYDLWLDGQFGNKKCKELLHLGNGTGPNQTEQFKRYTEARKIHAVRNEYDYQMTISPDGMLDGREVGWIIYLGGRKEAITFHDTGMNDDVVYDFCSKSKKKKVTMTWGEMNKKLGMRNRTKRLRYVFDGEIPKDDFDTKMNKLARRHEKRPAYAGITAGVLNDY